MNKFPNGQFSAIARLRLGSLEGAVGSSSDNDVAAYLSPATSEELRELTRQIQFDLNRLGCDPGAADGVWGQRSRSALQRLQRSGGISSLAGPPSAALARQLSNLNGANCKPFQATTQTSQNAQQSDRTFANLILPPRGTPFAKITPERRARKHDVSEYVAANADPRLIRALRVIGDREAIIGTFDDKLYIAVLSWNTDPSDAANMASAAGGELADLTSREEDTFVYNLVNGEARNVAQGPGWPCAGPMFWTCSNAGFS